MIEKAKDRSTRKGGVKGVQSFLLEQGPIPWLVFSSEKIEGGYNMGEIGDEFVIEICEPQEGVNAFDGGGGFSVMNSGQSDRVHHNLSLANDHAEELHLRGIKEAFGESQGETMFLETKEYVLGVFMVKD